MYILFSLTVVAVLIYYTRGETTKETTDIPPSKIAGKETPPETATWDDSNQHINSIWAYHPASHSARQEDGVQRAVHMAPQSLTRIAKTVSLGFDPYFNKGYFEPFEKRPKPVTLVGLRKNGLFPRQNINVGGKSSEVAELQSPYNHVSSFWVEERV